MNLVNSKFLSLQTKKFKKNPNFITLKANLNLSKNIPLMKALIFLNLNVTYL